MLKQFIDKYVIVRSNLAGVFFGKVKYIENTTVILEETRKIYAWSGAATVSQIAVTGVSKSSRITCKTHGLHLVNDIVELIEATPSAVKNLQEVPEWVI